MQDTLRLRPFQKAFIKQVENDAVSICALSVPRGNGKSTLCGWIAARIMEPTDAMFRAGTESCLVAGSIEQARIIFRVARGYLGEAGYRFVDGATRVGITHLESRTRLRIMGSNAKTAMGLLGTPWVICDEPGSWEVNQGEAMWTTLTTAQGKPDSPLRIIIVGTLAPMGTPGHWWHDLVERGSHGSTYVMAIAGNAATWSTWPTIRRSNPLTAVSAPFRKKLLEERDAALSDSRLRGTFLSFRLNQPTPDASTMLLDVDEWKRVLSRDVPDADGAPFVGIDLAAGRAWAAAVAMWHNGRTEAIALAPGLPTLAEQAKRDRVPAAAYQRLFDDGVLFVDEDLRVQRPSLLIDLVVERWGVPALVICDRFRLSDLLDAVDGICEVEPRVTRWSEASADIRALRKMALDGPLSVEPQSDGLIGFSLSKAKVESDDSGNSRLVKQKRDNVSRDDVAMALTLAAGAVERYPEPEQVEPWGAIVV